ncbi:hypothetical protein EV360DRAFT_89154 [Lentinula raphanica]|nr:hypothetical protein EV360DRAFT_89154 [Lentinula raphanica]
MNHNAQQANGGSAHADDVSVQSVEDLEVQEFQPEFQPPASPHGWGLLDVNWSGGWGPTPGNNQVQEQTREAHISRSTALRNLRSDFNNADLSFKGRQGCDTNLDALDTKVWASVQWTCPLVMHKTYSYRCDPNPDAIPDPNAVPEPDTVSEPDAVPEPDAIPDPNGADIDNSDTHQEKYSHL